MTKFAKNVAWVLIILIVGLVAAAVLGNETATWREAPRPLQSAVQPPQGGWSELTHDGAVEASTAVSGLARCLFEDGNPDGKPCLWHDRNGNIYYVDSSEYRR